MNADIEINGDGFYQLSAGTHRGAVFMRGVQGYDRLANVAYSDDARMTRDIADGAFAKGLRVDVNGTKYEGQG